MFIKYPGYVFNFNKVVTNFFLFFLSPIYQFYPRFINTIFFMQDYTLVRP